MSSDINPSNKVHKVLKSPKNKLSSRPHFSDIVKINQTSYKLITQIAKRKTPTRNVLRKKPLPKMIDATQMISSSNEKALIKYFTQKELFDKLWPETLLRDFEISSSSLSKDDIVLRTENLERFQDENFFKRYSFDNQPFNAGGFGDVWRARKFKKGLNSDDEEFEPTKYVVKRIVYSQNSNDKLSALREVHFGRKMADAPHVAKFVEHFDDRKNRIFWLVFLDEGVSLNEMLYDVTTEREGVCLFKPSKKWLEMKKDGSLNRMVKDLASQLLQAVKSCHSRGVLHRDIKPNNILINEKGIVRLIDFGSAVDSLDNSLYGDSGPKQEETTLNYAPPEVFFDVIPFSPRDKLSYDLWSVGVVLLEMILATPNVFKVSDKAMAIINSKCWNESREFRDKACKFKAFIEFGIFRPISFSRVAVAEYTKGDLENIFRRKLRECDQSGLGYHDYYGIPFLLRLLMWDAKDRIKVNVALSHAYFKGPYLCLVCGEEFELKEDVDCHCTKEHLNLPQRLIK